LLNPSSHSFSTIALTIGACASIGVAKWAPKVGWLDSI
jgi:hypothetical protein